MNKIHGVSLGNWLVLEKWMMPQLFEGTDSEDEVWLNRKSEQKKNKTKMKYHRDTYITEQDFKYIAEQGLSLIRIPVPYFIFGDREPFIGCIEYLDKAFTWAEKYHLKILIDLHTVPESQNGYDNGGITGVCKWYKNKEEVRFVLSVLERLAKRYGTREGLFGIEVLNEPISWLVWMTSPSRKKAEDKEEAKGSGHVPTKFLKKFYLTAYRALRKYLPEEKTIVFHDGFRLGIWKDFFVKHYMINVMLDTHIYILAMEAFVKLSSMNIYRFYVWLSKRSIQKAAKYTPVMVGEWCLANRLVIKKENKTCKNNNVRNEINQKLAEIQLSAWDVSAGWIYWSYQLQKNMDQSMAKPWLPEWDFRICRKNQWLVGLNKTGKEK